MYFPPSNVKQLPAIVAERPSAHSSNGPSIKHDVSNILPATKPMLCDDVWRLIVGHVRRDSIATLVSLSKTSPYLYRLTSDDLLTARLTKRAEKLPASRSKMEEFKSILMDSSRPQRASSGLQGSRHADVLCALAKASRHLSSKKITQARKDIGAAADKFRLEHKHRVNSALFASYLLNRAEMLEYSSRNKRMQKFGAILARSVTLTGSNAADVHCGLAKASLHLETLEDFTIAIQNTVVSARELCATDRVRVHSAFAEGLESWPQMKRKFFFKYFVEVSLDVDSGDKTTMLLALTKGIRYLPETDRRLGVEQIISEAIKLPSNKSAIVLAESPNAVRYLTGTDDRKTICSAYLTALENLDSCDTATAFIPLMVAERETVLGIICPVGNGSNFSFNHHVTLLSQLPVAMRRLSNCIEKFDVFTYMVRTTDDLLETHAPNTKTPVDQRWREISTTSDNFSKLNNARISGFLEVLDAICPEDGDVTGNVSVGQHVVLLAKLPDFITLLPFELRLIVLARIATTASTLLTKTPELRSDFQYRSSKIKQVFVNLTAVIKHLPQTQSAPVGQNSPPAHPQTNASDLILAAAEKLHYKDKITVRGALNSVTSTSLWSRVWGR